MNSSVISWISQQGIDSSSMLMDQYDLMDSFDEDLIAAFGQDFKRYYLNPQSSNSISSSTAIDTPATGDNSFYAEIEQAKQPMPHDHNYSKFSAINNMGILNFGNQNPPQNVQPVNPVAPNLEEDVVNIPEEATVKIQPTKKKRVRPPSQTCDHIIAERKRREQLSQLLVALSALIPGLKKMDKSSILEDAIKYMKLLQERVKILEEKAEKKAMESVVVVRKSQIVVDDGEQISSSVDDYEQPLPEIQARVCDNNILIRVHCEKQKDALANLICKVESLNMIVVSTNATPFGDVALDITIVAEMEKEFNLTVKEVVTALRAALQPAA